MALHTRARLLLLPYLAALLLSSAHFVRGQQEAWALSCLVLVALLLIRQPLCLRLHQLCALLLSAEWIHTLAENYALRSAFEQPWLRMSLILGAVICLHLAAALLFQHELVRRYFGFTRSYLFR